MDKPQVSGEPTPKQWEFEADGRIFKFRTPTAEDVLNAYNENFLPKQEKLRKLQKHAREDPDLLVKFTLEAMADQKFAFYSAALVEPKLSISELRVLDGVLWMGLENAIDIALRTGEVKFRLRGPGIEEPRDVGEENGEALLARISRHPPRQT